MSFTSLATLAENASAAGLAEQVVAIECEDFGATRDAIIKKTDHIIDVMESAAHRYLDESSRSLSGLTGGYACLMNDYNAHNTPLSGMTAAVAAAYALSCSEVNASMGVIAAAPTAGSCGILPGVLFAVAQDRHLGRSDIRRALLTATGIGAVIATRATLAGSAGGCQAECGSAAAMAAAGACELMGADADTVINAAALALKNVLGLACDPVCGLVEIPCVKRNGMFVSLALMAADMSMAGIKSNIPADEVIDAMFAIGSSMPASIRESGTGGLAATPTAKEYEKELKL